MTTHLSSPQTQTKGPLGRVLRVLGLSLMAVFLTGAGCDVGQILPASGIYDGPVQVTMEFPGADEIWYTLDGTEPTSACISYQPGEIITLESTAVVKARGIARGSEVIYSDIVTNSYVINGTGGGVDDSTNREAIDAWLEYEIGTRQVFSDKYFGGCEPVVGCGGGLDTSQLGKYYICDADSNIVDPAACENAGGGWISWNVTQEGLGGGSEFVYSNYSYTLASGQPMTASGIIVGHFDSNGTGSTSTAEGDTIVLSGAYNAQIEDAVNIAVRQKVTGSYYVSCQDTGCASTPLTYLVTPGPTLQLAPATAASCATAPEFIRIQQGNSCITASPTAFFAEMKSCVGELSTQQWEILENTASAEPEDFSIQLKDGSACLSAKPSAGGPYLFFEAAACVANDPAQVFTFEKSTGVVGKAARIVSHPDAFGDGQSRCLAPFSAGTQTAVLGFDCSDTSQGFDFDFSIGNSFPTDYLDPTTDLLAPLLPVTFSLNNRAESNHQTSVVIPSPIHSNLSLTATAQNNAGSAKKVSASNLEGFGVYTSGANLNGIQTNEQLVLTFDQPVDISNVTLRQWEGPDELRVRWNGENFDISSDSDALNSEESVDLDLKGVTWIAFKGNSFLTVTYVKSITVTPTLR